LNEGEKTSYDERERNELGGRDQVMSNVLKHRFLLYLFQRTYHEKTAF
jgi:hypothetical protein